MQEDLQQTFVHACVLADTAPQPLPFISFSVKEQAGPKLHVLSPHKSDISERLRRRPALGGASLPCSRLSSRHRERSREPVGGETPSRVQGWVSVHPV